MSGITGIWKLDGAPVERSEIKRFNDTLKQRGRADSGIYMDESRSLALGHRRHAAPNPLKQVVQPLSYGDGRYWIVLDGEIYNSLPIRRELQQSGYGFGSQDDAEVVLAAYVRWGVDCQFKFNGNWAFVIWDASERRLFLARDRFGRKPLYYCYLGDHFAFASELKAFLALPWLDVSFDPVYMTTTIRSHLHLHSMPETFLRNVRQLEVGCCMFIDQVGQLKQDRWWRTVSHLETPPKDFNQQVERFQEIFTDACALRTQDPGTVGISLSGGLDSTSVFATIVQLQSCVSEYNGSNGSHLDLPIQAYIAYLNDPNRDERDLANMLIQKTGIRACYEPVLTPVGLIELDTMLFEQEDIGITLGSHTIAKAMARDGIAYALTGDGPEHQFGAMLAAINVATAEALLRKHKLRRLVEVLSLRQAQLTETRQTRLTQRIRVLTYSLMPVIKYFIKGRAGFRPDRVSFFKDEGFFNYPVMPLNFDDFNRDCSQFGQNELLIKTRYFKSHFGLTIANRLRKERIYSNNGIEMRTPFIDWRLACFALSLPSESVIRDGYTKPIIREAMRGLLPEEIRTRKSKMALIDTNEKRFRKMKPIMLETIGERFFLDSELWHGPELATSIERAYKEQHYGTATLLQRCVLAARLQHVFMEKRRELLAS